jgi:hypothetical protein
MVARTRFESGLLLVRFESDGEEPEACLASNGERALRLGLLMLARRDALRAGDRLTVSSADDGVELLQVPR